MAESRSLDKHHKARPVSPSGDAGALSRRAFAPVALAGASGLLRTLTGCTRPSAHEPVTLTLVEQSPGLDDAFREARSRELKHFFEETGIRVQSLPTPESAEDQLALWRRLLDSHASTPDVFSVDCIWPGMLAEHMIDLGPAFASELGQFLPGMVENYTVSGSMMAVPASNSTGFLFYRKDLLEKYGYRTAPVTWEDLERMAIRIQAAERAAGDRDFWGYVWQGAGGEALVCNALEWQTSEGGGLVIEKDGTVSVNNPRAIAAWERAARWVGTISPPTVVDYMEWDAANVWQSKKAAFMRNWPNAFLSSSLESSGVRGLFGIAVLPAGRAGHWGTTGGSGYAVSRYSVHRQEAIATVRFLTQRSVQRQRALMNDDFPTIADLYRDPALLARSPYLQLTNQEHFAVRPSAVCGKHYQQVSNAYAGAVHSVLTGKQAAASAAADLEGILNGIVAAKSR